MAFSISHLGYPISQNTRQTRYSAGVHPTAITQPYNIVRFPNAALDCQIFRTLRCWATRRHPNKGARWVTRKYFLPEYAQHWCFQGRSHLDGVTTSEYLTQLVTIPIKRHTKIRSEATPYDPAFASY
ncbi:hypothetical protein BSU18_004840 [Salmonella enterica subsp. enterica serovar Pomona]|nr:hypothetical protein [Salmonella enterica subsp. enterica serovar Pomona]